MNYSSPYNINNLTTCCLKFIKGGRWEIPELSDVYINKKYT